MTAVIFGPPPLPPNKKSLLTRHHSHYNVAPPQRNRGKFASPLLSSTYRSFRDPADDPIILSLMTSNTPAQHNNKKHSDKCSSSSSRRLPRRRTLSSHLLSQTGDLGSSTESSSDGYGSFDWTHSTVDVTAAVDSGVGGGGGGGFGGGGGMFRSQSEGNLRVKEKDAVLPAPMTINKYMKVLSNSWKNLLNLGGMSRPPKPAATAKKVAPPAVPHEFRHSGSSFGSASAGYASSSSDEAAVVYLAPPGGGGGGGGGGGVVVAALGNQGVGGGGGGGQGEPPGGPRDDHSDYGSSVSGSTGKSPGPVIPAPTFSFPGAPPPGTVLTHKAAVYYHHQLSLQEDQGIDMTQSPGRDSPGSSSGSAGSGSRHSTASLDSGRASYHPLGGSSTATGGGRSTIGSANSPRCSLSSCSIGSVPEQGRIERMINQGLPDQEIIHAWLVDLQFDEYFPLFLTAGYDLPTIGRMTPEDLTAIGIKKPNHRKRLKAEIAQLNLPDNLPDYIPGSLEEWLSLLRLDEYQPAFFEQGYHTVDAVAQQLTWEDLEEFGVVKLGHQKKIMLAIKRIKDIRSGKRFSVSAGTGGGGVGGAGEVGRSVGYTHQDVVVHAPQHGGGALPPSSPGTGTAAQATPTSATGVNNVPSVHSTFRSFHQPWELDQTRQLVAAAVVAQQQQQQQQHQVYGYQMQPQSQSMYCTDVVPIKIRTVRGKSLESLEDPSEHALAHPHPHHPLSYTHPHHHQQQQQPTTHHTFSPDNTATFYYSTSSASPTNQASPTHGHGHAHAHLQQQQMWRPRSYDDGDITPTNDGAGLLVYEGGGGTLPRPRCVIKPRPVAKIQAKCREGGGGGGQVATVTGPVSFPDYEKPHFLAAAPPPPTITSATYKPLMDPLLYHHHHHQMQLHQQQQHHHLQQMQQYHHHHQQHQAAQMAAAAAAAAAAYGASPVLGKKIGPNPPKRMDSVGGGGIVVGSGGECCVGEMGVTTVEVHQVQSCSSSPLTICSSSASPSANSTPLPLPAYPSSDSLSISLDAATLPPPPAPGTPPGGGKMNASRSWGADSESEHELIHSLTLQCRNGSDASFKSSSSTESDSLPFANENAGTIRTRPNTSSLRNTSSSSSDYSNNPSHQSPSSSGKPPRPASAAAGICQVQSRQQTSEDVLSDIGNMLTNLTNELDAMLEEEKRMEQQQQQQ